MTTVATDGRTMAADGLALRADNVVATDRRKLRRLGDGSIIGTAGNSAAGELVARWLEAGAAPSSAPALGDAEATVLRLYPDGRLTTLSAPLLVELDVDAPAAIGSGTDIALGALAMGATPSAAVAIASRFDIGTGGAILELEPGA